MGKSRCVNEMLRIFSAFVCLSLVAAQVDQYPEGYIFTSPRSIKTGTDNQLQLQRFGKLDAGTLKIKVYCSTSYNGNETLHTEKEFTINEGEQTSTLQLFVEPFDEGIYVYNGRLEMNGTFGEHVIGGSDKVFFSNSKSGLVLVQTDRPLYKPGQEVKFRVLKLDKNLKPSEKENDVADIFVEDPKGTRLFQFKKVKLGDGLSQMEFPLSDEPILGTWKITVKTKGSTDTGNFDVKEYVLPKFDVKIKFPPFVLANADLIPVEICAKYTYGKNVNGQLNLTASLETYSWSREKNPVLEETIKLDGCYNYSINVSLIEPGSQYRYRRIMVLANVTEDGTGVQRSETQYLQRQYSPLNLNFNSDQKQYFKPGLPYNGKLHVTNPDDTPAASEEIELCATIQRQRVIAQWWATRKIRTCKNYTSDAAGNIEYAVMPQNVDSISILVEAKSTRFARDNSDPDSRDNLLNQPQTSMSLSPYYSPSGSFMQFAPLGPPVACGTKANFKLLFTSKEDADFIFYYQIVKRGAVVRSGSVEKVFYTKDDVSSRYNDDSSVICGSETQLVPPPDASSPSSATDDDCPAAKESKYTPPIGEVDIEIDVDASLSPGFNILGYYVRSDKETVADSQKIEVQKCFKNEVDFKFGDKVKQPGTKTKVTVKASPNSLCGLKLVDKSVSLLDSSEQVTKDKIFQLLQDMDSGYYFSSNPCTESTPQPGLYSASSIIRPPGPSSSSSYSDSLAAFQDAGFLVISDYTIFTRPCQNSPNFGGYGSGAPGGSGGPGAPVALASVARRPAAPMAAAPPMPESAKAGGASPTKSAVEVRDYFPETWLFDLELIGPDGVLEEKQRLPHTITEWDGSAVCVSKDDGLGISDTDTIKGFQAFFLSTTLPASVVRGEKFTVPVSVFNYAEAPLPITVKVDQLAGFDVTSNSVDGDICVEPGEAAVLKIQLMGSALGLQNITIRASTADSPDVCGGRAGAETVARDAITNSLEVKAEGFPQESVTSYLFCPADEETQSYSKSIALNLPDDVVPDSTRAVVDLTGNVMGPAIENANNLVTMPTGCGEQNMVKFAPNYYVLDYLTDIGKLTNSIRNRAVKNLQTGYQRELTYRHSDGSFSAFGPVDKEGSMFLTAFVLRSFYEAKRYITIDDSIITSAQEFIVSKQQEDGCFPDVGKIIDRGLQGGIEKEKSSGSITAYVLASLKMSGYLNETVTSAAQQCLKEDSDLTPYQTFLYAYAESKVGDVESAKGRLQSIRVAANKTGGVEFYHNPNGTKAIDLETAAYAVLTILETGGSATDALPIVRFMTQSLNPRGGFYSTQDTCVGLDALSHFARLVYRDPVSLTASLTGSLNETVGISEDNKLLIQRSTARQIPGQLNLQVTGQGCGLIQSSLRYNTRTPPQKLKFYLEVVGSCLGDACRRASLKVSAIYLPENEKSGMAVIKINMISGIVPVKDSLEKLKADSNLQLMRYDVENNAVVLYFSEVSNAGKYLSFEVEKVVDVENPQPAQAQIFDYYAPENEATTSYLLTDNSQSATGASEATESTL